MPEPSDPESLPTAWDPCSGLRTQVSGEELGGARSQGRAARAGGLCECRKGEKARAVPPAPASVSAGARRWPVETGNDQERCRCSDRARAMLFLLRKPHECPARGWQARSQRSEHSPPPRPTHPRKHALGSRICTALKDTGRNPKCGQCCTARAPEDVLPAGPAVASVRACPPPAPRLMRRVQAVI